MPNFGTFPEISVKTSFGVVVGGFWDKIASRTYAKPYELLLFLHAGGKAPVHLEIMEFYRTP